MKSPCPNCSEYMKFFVHFVAPKVWSFTIYKQKPVGARFVQMVSKNSQMGNLVGNGVYHLQNPFKVTERVWRDAKSWEYANVNKFSDWKFRLGILDYLSRNPVFSGKFYFGKTKEGLPFTFQPKLPYFCGKW